VSIAVSTGGGSPYLAKELKGRVSRLVGPEYAALAKFLAKLRRSLPVTLPDAAERKKFWKSLFACDPAHVVRAAGIDALAKKTSRLLKRFGVKAAKP
jgi:siroheme synthase-like protein